MLTLGISTASGIRPEFKEFLSWLFFLSPLAPYLTVALFVRNFLVKVATAPGRSYTPNHLGNEVLDEIEAFVETVKNSKTSLLKPLFAARKVQEKLAALTA